MFLLSYTFWYDIFFILYYERAGLWLQWIYGLYIKILCFGVRVVYNSKLKDEYIDRLFSGILMLKSQEECYRFFEDICTVNELKSLAQRLEVARMLKNKKTYNEIAQQTGASTATISRVNRCLTYGADGYNLVLQRLDGESDIEKK
jgi:TrpR-related protein YerC/YecD